MVGLDPCVHGEEPCKFCVILTPEQILKLVVPNIKLERKRRMTPYVRQRRKSINLNQIEPLNQDQVLGVFHRRRLIISILTPQWRQALGNKRVLCAPRVTNQHGGLLAVVQIQLDHQKADGGVASAAQSPPMALISLNANYCLSVHTAPNSVKELSVGFIPNQDFVPSAQNVNFVLNNLRLPQKKGVSPPVNPTNVSIKDVNFVHRLSYSVFLTPAPVMISSVPAEILTPKLSLGSSKAKIQTGTQSQSSGACILKSCCDSCTFFLHMFFKEASLLGNAPFLRKHVGGVSSVSQSASVTNVDNVPAAVETWASMGANPRVVYILKNGYTLPFRTKPPLTREPLVQSGYVTPVRQDLLQESVQSTSKTSHRTSSQPVLPRVLQPPLFGSKNKQQMASHFVSQRSEPVSASKKLQDGNSRVKKVVSSAGGVGHFARLQRCLLPHPCKPAFQKVSTVPSGRSNCSFEPLHRSYGVHHCGQGSKTHGSGKGNPVTPVPGRLTDPESDQGILLLPDTGPSGSLSGAGLSCESSQIRTGSKTSLRLCGLPVRPKPGSSPTAYKRDPFSGT